MDLTGQFPPSVFPTASFTQPSSYAAQYSELHDFNAEPSGSESPPAPGAPGAPPMSLILTIRLLMQGKEVGSIIGKRGDQIKLIREESGAKINISDGSCPERIVTITGSLKTIDKSFAMICNKFSDDMKALPNSVPKPPITMRMIIPATQCGSLIGKGGSKIKEIRETTGASLQVASEMLPSSTERAVTLSGTADAIVLCMKEICNILLEAPPKGATLQYRPKPTFNPLLIASSAAQAAAQQQAVAALLSQPFHGQPIMAQGNGAAEQLTRAAQLSAMMPGAQLSMGDPTAATSYAGYIPMYGGMLMSAGDASAQTANLMNAQNLQAQWAKDEAKKYEQLGLAGLGQYAALNTSMLLGTHLVKGASPPSSKAATQAGQSSTRFAPY
ncbi:unnamed protein product, partial [Mesorhabditis spiculigera]